MRVRGFEVVRGLEAENIKLPVRKTRYSAGYDIEAPKDYILPPQKLVTIATGVKAYMPEDEYLAIFIRSSMGIKNRLSLANGQAIIDSDYYGSPESDGHIFLTLINNGEQDFHLPAGTCFAQGIFSRYFKVDNEPEISAERVSGIGSTNK